MKRKQPAKKKKPIGWPKKPKNANRKKKRTKFAKPESENYPLGYLPNLKMKRPKVDP